MRKLASRTAVVVLLAAALALTFWLGTVATTTSPVRPRVAAPGTIMVTSGTLESVQPVEVTAEWRADRALFNRMSGTVTSLGLRPGATSMVTAGMTIMHVDAEAVVALPGEVPAYRDIVAGSEGEDVLQVQGFLAAEGALIGELAGRWDRATANAWRGWRRDHGLSADTTLALGQVIFVPQLPRRVTAVDSLVVGAIVSSVEQIGSTVLAAPEFSITLAVGADRIVAAGASVSVRVGEEEVGAVVSDRRSSRDAGVRIELDLVGGCAAWCDSISTTAPQTASGTVRISEPVTGAIVPLGALRSGTGTASAVVMADGTARTVTVRVAVNGQAVVDGIAPGDTIRLPAATATAATTSESP